MIHAGYIKKVVNIKLSKNRMNKALVYLLILAAVSIVVLSKSSNFGFVESIIKIVSLSPNSGKYAKFCNYLAKDSRFECYSRFIYSVPKNDSRTLIYLANLTAKNLKIRECHFLHHDIGIRLIENMNTISAMNGCKEFQWCMSGCEHGIGQGLLIKSKGRIIEEWDEALKLIDSYKDSVRLMHGFGHSASKLYENYTKISNFCQNLSKGNENFMRTCVAGANHEHFFHIYTNVTYINFQNEHEACNDFKQHKDICTLYLSFEFSSEKIWDDTQDMNYPQRVISYCNNFEDVSCYDGVAMGVISIYNMYNKTINNRETVQFCQKFFDSEKLNPQSCIRGLLDHHFLFAIAADYAFQTCHNLNNTDDNNMCFSYLSFLYNRKHVPNNIHFCTLVDKKERDQCFLDFLKLQID